MSIMLLSLQYQGDIVNYGASVYGMIGRLGQSAC